MTQLEALRLSDALEISSNHGIRREAAAELRRLHASCEDYAHHKQRQDQRILKLYAQRDALLEALKSTGLFLHHCWCDVQMNDYSFEKLNQQMQIVDAAIKAAEENT
jgi:hypothetical protein